MNITALIRDLLFGHDCVIIPGFGGFIGNYTPARLDRSTGTFHPPVKQISFNRNLDHNDGLLIKEISAVTGVNYGDARNMAEEYASGIRKKLDRGEKVVMEDIGSFILNHEGNVQFEPLTGINYNLDSFGLESLQCIPLEGYDVKRKIPGIHPVRPKQYSLRKYVWRAAVLIPFAAAVFFVSTRTDLFRHRIETSTMNPLVSAELEHNMTALEDVRTNTIPESAIATEEKTDSETTAAESDIQPVSEPPAKTALAKTSGAYFVITGSFQSAENAGKQVSLLQAEGFNPEIVAAENGFFRVCAVTCPDLETAVIKKDSIVAKFPGAWISRKK